MYSLFGTSPFSYPLFLSFALCVSLYPFHHSLLRVGFSEKHWISAYLNINTSIFFVLCALLRCGCNRFSFYSYTRLDVEETKENNENSEK